MGAGTENEDENREGLSKRVPRTPWGTDHSRNLEPDNLPSEHCSRFPMIPVAVVFLSGTDTDFLYLGPSPRLVSPKRSSESQRFKVSGPLRVYLTGLHQGLVTTVCCGHTQMELPGPYGSGGRGTRAPDSRTTVRSSLTRGNG